MNKLSRRQATKLMTIGGIGISVMPSLMSFQKTEIMKKVLECNADAVL